MNKILQKISYWMLGISFMAALQANAQSVVRAPGRTADYTITGFFTQAAPVIDGVLDDFVWTSSTTDPLNPGAGYNATTGVFPSNTEVKEEINLQDSGTDAGNPPAKTTSGYPAPVMATFGTAWDKDFVYFAVKVPAAAFAGATFTMAGVELFFNSGNGVSKADPLSANWPRNFSNVKDFQIVIGRVPGTTTEFYTLNSTGISWFGATPGDPEEYKLAGIKNADGSFSYEGQVSWKVVYKEFLDESTGLLSRQPHKSTVPGLRFDVGVNGLQGSDRVLKMWNQCCYNANWTQSQFFGHLDLEGDIKDVACPTGITVTGASNITTANGTVTVGATIEPAFATKAMQWSLTGKNGIYDLAEVDANTGKITPLNDGVLTVVGKARNASCTVTGTATLTISNQVAPTSNFRIDGDEISGNWNAIDMVAVANANASSRVTWSVDPASNLVQVNSITGTVKATALGNGSVTIKATSLANGVTSSKTVNVKNQVVLSCVGINSFTRVNQCDRTLSNLTITQFTVGARLEPLMQYYDPASSVPGIVPTDLVDFRLSFPGSSFASIAKNPNWNMQLNAAAGTFTITGTYKNDPSIKTAVRVVLRASTTITGCDNTVLPPKLFSIGFLCAGVTTTGIGDPIIQSNSFAVYPNPASDEVTLSYDLVSGGQVSVVIVNTLGVAVASGSQSGSVGKNSLSISTASLTPGIYIVKASVSGGGTVAKKLLISK